MGTATANDASTRVVCWLHVGRGDGAGHICDGCSRNAREILVNTVLTAVSMMILEGEEVCWWVRACRTEVARVVAFTIRGQHVLDGCHHGVVRLCGDLGEVDIFVVDNLDGDLLHCNGNFANDCKRT